MPENLDSVKFAVSGGLISALFMLLVDAVLWVKFVPLYNSIILGIYGTGGFATATLVKFVLISLVLAFVIGFVLGLVFAWIYNKLPTFKFAG